MVAAEPPAPAEPPPAIVVGVADGDVVAEPVVGAAVVGAAVVGAAVVGAAVVGAAVVVPWNPPADAAYTAAASLAERADS